MNGMKLGGGGRFSKLAAALGAKGARDPGALAASIGKKKYGAGRMEAMASAGRKKRAAGIAAKVKRPA